MTERRRLRRSVATWQGLAAGLAIMCCVGVVLTWRWQQARIEEIEMQLREANDENERRAGMFEAVAEQLGKAIQRIEELEENTTTPKLPLNERKEL